MEINFRKRYESKYMGKRWTQAIFHAETIISETKNRFVFAATVNGEQIKVSVKKSDMISACIPVTTFYAVEIITENGEQKHYYKTSNEARVKFEKTPIAGKTHIVKMYAVKIWANNSSIKMQNGPSMLHKSDLPTI